MGSFFSVENPILSMDKSLREQGYNTPCIMITPDIMPNLKIKWYNPGTKTERTLAYTYKESMSPDRMIEKTEEMLCKIKISRRCDPSVSTSSLGSIIYLS